MIAKRKKHLNLRLPPRVDAYMKKDGTFSFRFKHWDGHYIKLGCDIEEARKKGHALNAGKPLVGSLAELIEEYWKSTWFTNLAPRTKLDYEEHSKQVIKVLGELAPNDITPQHLGRYLRMERASAPVRANREIRGFLSTVYEFGIEIGSALANPCRQIRRNKETPRTRKVETHELAGVVEVAKTIGPSAQLITLAAEFCAIAGRRRQDVLRLPLPKHGEMETRIEPQKVKRGEAQMTIEIPLTPGLLDIIERAKEVHRLRERLFDEREAKRLAKGKTGKEQRPVRSMTWIFCTQQGQPYSDAGFKTMWNKIQVKWEEEGGTRFTFHDLRAYYVTEAKAKGWQVSDTTGHKDESTANKIYDRRRVRKARPLK